MFRTHLIAASALCLTTLLGAAACDTQRANTGASDESTAVARSAQTSGSPSSVTPSEASGNTNTASSYDLKFIDTMTQHHRDGLQMAKMATTKASHSELKQMAQKMVDGQQKEIAQMQSWRDAWFPSAPAAIDHQMPGMAETMKTMQADMSKLMRATGNDFDHQFIDVMSKHHASAIAMGKEALGKAQRSELKELATKIVDEQSKDNDKMKTMSAQWFPGHSHDNAARGQ